MKVHNAEIVISAVSPKQYPETDLPEIALAGRSNVGKSSFINTLIDRKNLARTSGIWLCEGIENRKSEVG